MCFSNRCGENIRNKLRAKDFFRNISVLFDISSVESMKSSLKCVNIENGLSSLTCLKECVFRKTQGRKGYSSRKSAHIR